MAGKKKVFTVKSVPRGANRGWKVKIDGVPQEVGKVEIASRFGVLTYGQRPEGWDGWVFKETGGGGAVTLPFTRMSDGTVLIGLIPEKRPNMGGEELCIVGGFVSPGESHDDAQTRVAENEAGLKTTCATELPGWPFDCNRLFFVADSAKGEGLHAYCLEIPEEYVVHGEDGFYYDIPDEDRGRFGKIANVVLMPIHCAIRATPDGIALAAIARLMSYLAEGSGCCHH